jgi:hypothetical protein
MGGGFMQLLQSDYNFNGMGVVKFASPRHTHFNSNERKVQLLFVFIVCLMFLLFLYFCKMAYKFYSIII